MIVSMIVLMISQMIVSIIGLMLHDYFSKLQQ